MSSIDRRVVEMEFDNKQFEAGIKDTLNSLEALKKGLQLDGAIKGMEKINTAGKNFSLEGMASALDNISDKFSVMGAIGFAIIQRLTNAAIDFGKKMAGMVLDPLVAGGKRRALNIEQAQFMFRGLGMDIEEAMANALYAVQGTAFGLDEAARAASQLGASQVALGDDMRQALRGISGVAAMTNSSYEDTARVFTRVAGQGRVMAVDLNSLAARGLNAAATLADAFGKTEAEIREMVTKGEVSFEMFAEAMDEAFGENATKANETYTGSLANLRAALSRIGASFFGPYLEQSRDLFNALTPAIDDVGEALKPVIEAMLAVSGRLTQNMIKSLNAMDFTRLSHVIEPLLGIIQHVFRILGELLRPIRDAFRQIFPPTSLEQIGAILSAIEEFIAKIKMGAESTENLRRTFAGVFAVFSIGWSVVKAFAIFLADIFGIVTDGSGGFLAATANVGDFLVALDQAIKNGEGLTNFFKGFSQILTGPINLLKTLGQALLSVFDFEAPDAERLTQAFEPLGRLGEFIVNIWSRIGGVLQRVWAAFQPLAEMFRQAFGWLGRIVLDAFEGVSFENILETVRTLLMGGILLTFRRFVENIGSSANSISGKLTAPFQKLTFTLNTMQNTLRAMTLMQIAIAVGILAAAVVGLSKVDSAGLARALGAMTAMFTQLFTSMAVFTRIGGVQGLFTMGAGLTVFALAIRVLTSSVKALAKLSWEDLAKGLSGVSVLIGALTLAVKGMSGHTKGMFTAGAGLLVLAFGIKVLASAVTDLAGMSWEEMARGLVGVGTLLTSLAIFTRLVAANKAGIGQGAGLVLLAYAIKLLAGAVGEFASMSWQDIGKGLTAVSSILAAFAAFSQVINPAGLVRAGASLVLIGASMNILAGAMAKFGNMSWEEIGKGLASMAGALLAITAALNLMPPGTLKSALSLVAISFALGLIAKAMADMGEMSWEEIGKGLTVIAGALGIIAIAMNAMSGTLAGAAATLVVAGALRILASVLGILGGMSWEEIIRGLTTLAGVFAILGIAALVLGPVVPVLLGLGAAVALLGAGMALAGAGVLAFSVALTALSVAGAAGTAAIVAMVAGLAGLIPMVARQIGLALVIFAKVIAESGPAMLDAMSTVLDAIIEAIRENAPNIIDLFAEMALLLVEKLVEIVPVIAAAGLEIMVGIFEAFNEYVPIIVGLMITLIIAILEEITAGVPDMAAAGTALIVAVLEGIAANLGDVITAGADIIIAFIRGISDNMVRIADEGMKAVISFVNGVADSIRANTPALQAAGRNLAGAIVSGLTGGLSDRVGDVARGAANLARRALDSAKSVLGVSSPSKEFEKIGRWTAEGFAKGLEGGRAEVHAALNLTHGLLKDAVRASSEEIHKHENRLKQLHGAREKDLEAIKQTEQALARAREEHTRSRAALDTYNISLAKQKEQIWELSKEYDRYTRRIEHAEQAYRDAVQTRNDYRRSIADQFDELPSIDKDTSLQDYINNLRYKNADIQKFASVLQDLRRMGLSDKMYKELLSKGPEALPMVEELRAGGKKSIAQVNSLSRNLESRAKTLGKVASDELYQAGVDAADGLLKGLQSSQKAIADQMAKIAKSIVDALKKELKIKSPSEVMDELGKSTVEGMSLGMRKSLPLIDKAVSGLGKSAIDSMKKSMADMAGVMDADMDLNPTITPVLDLSAFRKEAGSIGSTLSTHQIDLDAAFSKAKYASSKYQANKSAEVASTTTDDSPPPAGVVFNQYNNSPKALSSAEIYRQTKNQLSTVKKGALTADVVESD